MTLGCLHVRHNHSGKDRITTFQISERVAAFPEHMLGLVP
jgi:hypothetical protein